jgi:hypothetical protein
MPTKARAEVLHQDFPLGERIYYRVHPDNIDCGKVKWESLTLPDMSVNRGNFDGAKEARKVYREWAVASFLVSDIPNRQRQAFTTHDYLMRLRHDPVDGFYSHSEIRVWRCESDLERFITDKTDEQFCSDDPDIALVRHPSSEWLDPDFHMKWRRRMARICEVPFGPRPELAE